MAAKKAIEKEVRIEVKGHSGYVIKPKIKKGWRQENYCTSLAYIFRRLALSLFKLNFFLWY